MYRFIAGVLLLIILLTGCASNTVSFQGQIEDVGEGSFVVNCTDEMNKGAKDNINSIGYGCPVYYSDGTIFYDTDGKSITIDKFLQGSEVKVILTKPVNIRNNKENKQPKILMMKEMILIN